MIFLWEILNFSLVLEFLEQGSQVQMLAGSMKVCKWKGPHVRIQRSVGDRGNRSKSALSSGVSAAQVQLIVECRNLGSCFYFVKRNWEYGYLCKVSQVSNFDKYFKNSTGQTRHIGGTRRACDSLGQRFSILAANQGYLGSFEKSWCPSHRPEQLNQNLWDCVPGIIFFFMLPSWFNTQPNLKNTTLEVSVYLSHFFCKLRIGIICEASDDLSVAGCLNYHGP